MGAFALSQTGCEWVLGGIPSQPRIDSDGGFDDSGTEQDGHITGHDAGVDADGNSVEEDAATVDGDGSVIEIDAEIADADTQSDAEGASDAGDDIDAAPQPCTDTTIWYRDEDRDGFGLTADAMQICPKPDGNWATRPGDCQDGNPAVNPGQVHYYDVAYVANDSTDSFDYNCDGQETGSGNQKASAGSCGALGALACDQGSGFSPSSRSGNGVDAHCGSRSYQTCKPGTVLGLLCDGATTESRPTGFVCR